MTDKQQQMDITESTPTGWSGLTLPLDWTKIIGQEHAKRAVEVALVGEHSLFLVGNRGSQAEDLAAWARKHWGNASAAYPCPCGHYGDKHHECTCSVRQIANYRKKMFPASPADITVEMPRVEQYSVERWMQYGCEPWENISQRIEAARPLREDPAYQSQELDGAGTALLSAYLRLTGAGGDEVVRILTVARTIATLSHEKQICTAHLAEAIQYHDRS